MEGSVKSKFVNSLRESKWSKTTFLFFTILTMCGNNATFTAIAFNLEKGSERHFYDVSDFNTGSSKVL